MNEPINICPVCYGPFTKGDASIKTSDDIAKHYWYHLLDANTPPQRLPQHLIVEPIADTDSLKEASK